MLISTSLGVLLHHMPPIENGTIAGHCITMCLLFEDRRIARHCFIVCFFFEDKTITGC